jgi:protocatechuate 3,4-dioxygenase, alpha subunit
MSGEPKLVPTSSQTVGPFFRIGLDYLMDSSSSPKPASHGTITIRGQVMDCDRAPVADAMLEFWNSSDAGATFNANTPPADWPSGFRRAATDAEGNFCVRMNRPVPIESSDGAGQAPHMLVLVFARGLLRHLISRVYFDGEPGNSTDPVLCVIPADRRHTLIAQGDGTNAFRWNVILQGIDETVFFAW